MRGRSTFVEYRGERSNKRKVRQGVPQGGVLSPALFNTYMSSLPTPPANIEVVTYADDITITSSGEPGAACSIINNYLDELAHWLQERSLRLSPHKSMACLFTTYSKEVGLLKTSPEAEDPLPLTVAGSPIPKSRSPKILGVTFDPMVKFNQHAKELKNNLAGAITSSKSLLGPAGAATRRSSSPPTKLWAAPSSTTWPQSGHHH